MDRPVRGTWELALELDVGARTPLFLQIARGIVGAIQDGRLKPGARLPGTRTLAQTLAVHRNTVLAAYAELLAEGWLESAAARGSFVSRALPVSLPRRFSPRAPLREEVPQRLGFDLGPGPAAPLPPPERKGRILFSQGVPDIRLVPVVALARALRRALRREARTVLRYDAPSGEPHLRRELARMLASTRGLATGPEDVFVTRGSQMALSLVGQALLAPGDVVAVEALGYRPAWEAFRQLGARLVPVPVDREGLRVDALGALVRRTRLRAVYVTPHHQYPTLVTLTAARRLALLELARGGRFAIIEDDYDHEFHYEGRPVLPLASADDAGVVVYVGTLAKLLAPGLRLGYVVAPRPLLGRLAALRFHLDRQGDATLERAVAELLEDGEVQRHARRARRIYLQRRELLVSLLRASLGDALHFDVPPGGMALWVRVAAPLDVDAWAARADRLGLELVTGRHFAFDGRPTPFLRLGYASLEDAELREAVHRLQASRPPTRLRPG